MSSQSSGWLRVFPVSTEEVEAEAEVGKETSGTDSRLLEGLSGMLPQHRQSCRRMVEPMSRSPEQRKAERGNDDVKAGASRTALFLSLWSPTGNQMSARDENHEPIAHEQRIILGRNRRSGCYHCERARSDAYVVLPIQLLRAQPRTVSGE